MSNKQSSKHFKRLGQLRGKKNSHVPTIVKPQPLVNYRGIVKDELCTDLKKLASQ